MAESGLQSAVVQGYLAHKKQRPPRNLQQDCAQGLMAVLGGWKVSCERGTSVTLAKARLLPGLGVAKARHQR